ncbi:MAG: hypothetical protein Kow0068_05300 [Marinilabiliales bacterium]
MKPIIEINNIGKKYKLRGQETPYLTFREALLNKNKVKNKKEFWALKGITFDVLSGDSIGIIGKNGAGKSTLLKILSKITPPTEGKIIARGRVASLLEVGTGFHMELTGMENIFLNGSILGLKKQEIKNKIDEIIDFAGVEKFIDTPLKHYSSGMQLRLAFAVAAHLEPEILIVDEVLAVGDAEFQKKSLGKMEEVTNQGRTVLFVSHNMAAVKNLCNKGILLNNGILYDKGNIDHVITTYKKLINQAFKTVKIDYGVFDLKNHENKKFNRNFGMQKVVTFCDGEISEKIYAGCNFRFDVEIINNEDCDNAIFGFVIRNSDRIPLIGINNRHIGKNFRIEKVNKKVVHTTINNFPLYKAGTYTVDLFLGNQDKNFDVIIDAFSFDVEIVDIYKTGNFLDEKLNMLIVNDIDINIE